MAKMPINVGNHLASRRAMKKVLDRQRVFVASRTYGPRGHWNRVLVAGELYDVSDADLERLQSGRTPQDLALEPVLEDW